MNSPRLADQQRALRHVFLRDMVLHASVGVHAFEHAATQRIRVNIDLAVEDDGAGPMSRAAPNPRRTSLRETSLRETSVGETSVRETSVRETGVGETGVRETGVRETGRDELSRVVDYEAVAEKVRTIVAAGHVSLVETLAERLAEACLTDPRVHLARIRVEKLDIFPDTASVGVEIERRNADRHGLIPHPG